MTGGRRRSGTIAKSGGSSSPETVRRIWERAEQCEDWRQFMTPDSAYIFHSIGTLVKSSLHAGRRVGADRVRTILDRTQKELEEL